MHRRGEGGRPVVTGGQRVAQLLVRGAAKSAKFGGEVHRGGQSSGVVLANLHLPAAAMPGAGRHGLVRVLLAMGDGQVVEHL